MPRYHLLSAAHLPMFHNASIPQRAWAKSGYINFVPSFFTRTPLYWVGEGHLFDSEMLSFIVLFQVSCIAKQPGKTMHPLLNCTYSTRLRSNFYLPVSASFHCLQPWPEVPEGGGLGMFSDHLHVACSYCAAVQTPDASVLGKGEGGQQPDVCHKKRCDKKLGIHSGNLDITNF